MKINAQSYILDKDSLMLLPIDKEGTRGILVNSEGYSTYGSYITELRPYVVYVNLTKEEEKQWKMNTKNKKK